MVKCCAGDNILAILNDEKSPRYSGFMASDCSQCELALKTDWSTELHKQTVDIDVILISDLTKVPKSKSLKSKKEEKREEIIKKASALRNSSGGVLFIHIKDINATNRSLHFFHELVDSRLDKLIGDGSLFVNNFQKVWAVDAGNKCYFEKAYEFLLLTVRGSSVVSTYDFKTRIATDESVNAPTSQCLFHLIFDRKQIQHTEPRILGPSFSFIDESRCIQLKAFRNNEFVDKITVDNVDSLVMFIWAKLRLREYITSFASITGGGSYLLGIEEVDTNDQNYSYKTSKPTGIKINPPLLTRIRSALLNKICDNILVQPPVSVDKLVKIEFHQLESSDHHFVLEVAVGHVNGCVFYDKDGPEAFMINRSKLQRIPFKKWLDKLQKYNK